MSTFIYIKRPMQFYHSMDEDHFFLWLEEIEFVQSVMGGHFGLKIEVKPPYERSAVHSLLALFMRYGLDMEGLQVFDTAELSSWLRQPEAYWYSKLFGEQSLET